MFTKLTMMLATALVALTTFGGAALAGDGKAAYGGSASAEMESGKAAALQERKAEVMRSGSSGGSIQQRFGSGSGFALGGGGSGTSESSSASGPTMGKQNLEGSIRRGHRVDGAGEQPRKWNGRPGGSQLRGDR